jgi:hypothetical protein
MRAVKEGVMAKWVLKGLGAASLLAVLAVFSMPVEAAEMAYKIPFGFTVYGAELPPGTYTVSTRGSALLVQGFNHGAVVLTIRLESGKDAGARLVFSKYGDQYVLRQAWIGESVGRELPRPRLERELAEATQKGATATAVERVVIPAL